MFALTHDRCSRLRHTRRFPPPWSVEEGETYFVVNDNDGQQLAYVYFEDEPRFNTMAMSRTRLSVAL